MLADRGTKKQPAKIAPHTIQGLRIIGRRKKAALKWLANQGELTDVYKIYDRP
jgi:hypothetical protein